MKKIIFFCFFLLVFVESKSQTFFKKNWLMISNDQLMVNNYVPLKIADLELSKNFNTKNPYTYLLLIGDESGRNHQLVYQTNFTGTVEFIGLSNGLYNQFKCTENTFWKFNTCVQQIDQSQLKSVFIEQIIDCILMRINDCE